MISAKHRRRLIAACLMTVLLMFVGAQPILAGSTVISFEQGEGFPAPGASFNGTTTNGGLVTWSSNNLNALNVDAGPPAPVTGSQTGFADGMAGMISQVTMDLSTPKALDSFWYAFQGGTFGAFNTPIFPRLEVEYFNATGQSIGINSFMAPYNTDGPNVPGSYPGGTVCEEFPGRPQPCGVGLDGSANPEFHQLFPTEPFQGVALSKLIFSSFENPERMGGALNVGSHAGSFFLEDITLSEGTTTFNPNNYLRISFEPNEGFPDAGGSETKPPYNLPAGGVLLRSRARGPTFPESNALTRGAEVEGIIDSFSIEDNVFVNSLKIDHGPGCGFADGQEGFCVPSSEPDPIHGTQMILVTSLGAEAGPALDPDFTVEIDLNDDAALAPVSFWYSYRGNGNMQTVDIEYFDLSGTSQGIESWEGSPDGGVSIGTDSDERPQFDKIVIGEGSKTPLPTVKGVALSKMIINSTHNIEPNNCSGIPNFVIPCHASFAMDDLLFECTTGNCPDYPEKVGPVAVFYGDFVKDGVLNAEDIDSLAAAIRDPVNNWCGGIEPINGGCPPIFHEYNVDGFGDRRHVPDEADFSFYITSKHEDRYHGTLFGDFDLNKIVNFVDFVILSNNFGIGTEENPTGWGQGNANTDVFTNFNDFVLLSNNFGMMAAGDSATVSDNVPEPASLALVTIGVWVLAGRWKSAKSH